ncbi:hypothetical protein D3C71_1475920 [compost metagenome]
MGKTLRQSGQQQKRRSPAADGVIGRNKGNQQAGTGHQQHSAHEHRAPPQFIGEDAEADAAERPQQKTGCKHGQGIEQGRGGIAFIEECRGDVDRCDGVDRPVEPLKQVSHAGGHQ